ncbi:MAG: glycosyltransferase [Acidobacteria bacterium]|nr:glycosyltransferase [Acidobacteriota bacterium]
MKAIQVPFCFYPDPIAGTEAYVEMLAYYLCQRNVEIVIAAPGEKTAHYKHNGMAVRRFNVSSEVNDIRDLYSEGDITASEEFARILDEEQPDIVHLHAFTRGVSLRLIREAKRRGIKVIFSYHTPTVSCQRGTLLRWGTEVCDGKLDVGACAACTLHSHGLSKTGSLILGNLPKFACGLLNVAGLSGGIWTALRMAELVALRHSTFRAMVEAVDQIIAHCLWTRDLLVRNNVSAEKITYSRYGHSLNGSQSTNRNQSAGPQSTIPVRIAFLGRMDRTKGPDILIQALRSLPEAPVELHLYGIVQSQSNTEYLDQLKKLAGTDSRISLLPAIPRERIIPLLQGYHFLAVPSRWFEVSPVVIHEAFAAGTPVIGSYLGGIVEMIEHEVNGLLVETDSVDAWSNAIRRCYEDRDLLERLQRGVRPSREMSDAAQEMLLLYEKAIKA